MSRLNLKKSGLSTPTASVWGSRVIISAIIQGAIITLLTLLSVAVQLMLS